MFGNSFFETSGGSLSKRLILSVLVTVVIILFLLLQISLTDLYQLLRTLDLFWATLGSIAYLFAILFRAIRFKWLLYSKVISFSDLFKITAFYHLSLMILPSKLGEFSLPYFLSKISGMNATEGLTSLIVSRVYDLFIVLMILLAVSIGVQGPIRFNPPLTFFLVFFLVGLVIFGLFYVSPFLKCFSNLLGRMSNWTGPGNVRFILWVQKKMGDMAGDFDAIKNRKTYFPVSATSVASWAMIFCAFYAYMRSFGVDIPLMKMLFGSTIGVIANTLPVSGIGNWGTLEIGWAAGFLMVGLSREKAIASGFGVHIITFIVCAIIAFFCWVAFRKKNPSPGAR